MSSTHADDSGASTPFPRKFSFPRTNSSTSTTSENLDVIENEDGKPEFHVSKSRVLTLINWVHVFKLYLPFVFLGIIIIIAYQVGHSLMAYGLDFGKFWSSEVLTLQLDKIELFDLGWKSLVLLAFVVWYLHRYEQNVYLLDFTTFEAPLCWRLTSDQLLDILALQGSYTKESLIFSEKILSQSGVGEETAWPPSIMTSLRNDGAPYDTGTEMARRESETVIFDCVRKLLKRTNTRAKDVDFLVINCSLFSPTPSLCSMVINEFNMRSDIGAYNLSGMGCSAGVISIELCQKLLAARPNSLALIVSHENLTQALYHGNERAFLLQNTLFRCGGAAVMLSNKWMDGYRAQFKLLTAMRTHYVAPDSYDCVYESEDKERNRGVRLSKDIVKVAGRALELNFTNLGPYVLPLSEQLKTVFWMGVRLAAKKITSVTGMKMSKIAPYIPDFKRGIDHFCIHAGGRGVIDGIEKNLSLSPVHVAASRHALYTYGNTSSSSIWYEMNYIRNFGKLSVGQRVLQVAFGSGFKCNSCVWLCIGNGANRPGRRKQISDRELERIELEKELDDEGYIKRKSETLKMSTFDSKGRAVNSSSGSGPKLTEEELKKHR